MGLWNWLHKLSSPLRAFWRWLRDGKGFDVAELARRLGVPVEQLQALRPSYTPRTIPKRSGGQRVLHVPSDELKTMQRLLLRRLLQRLRCHPAATGFERGQSIVTNALPHSGQAVVVRLDVQNFFPTTSARRLHRFFRRIGWNRPATRLLVRLCTHAGGLPQGGATSPRLSNLVNYRLDRRIAAMAVKLGARYTRYADDITLSFSRDDRDRIRYMIRFVRRVLGEEGYRLHGRKKRRILRQHQRQQVTGLVVNAGPRLPRRLRRWLRAVEHHLAAGRPTTLTPQQLAGWRALCAMVTQQAGSAWASSPSAAGPLQGAWVLVAIEHDGRAAPTYAQSGPDPVVWVFGPKELRIVQGEREQRAVYLLDVSTEPRSITITQRTGAEVGQSVQGIYLLEGDQLTICLSEQGKEAPRGFTPEPGAGQTVFSLRAASGLSK